jgi:hypothetical protein
VLVLDAPAAADQPCAALDRLCNKAGLALANAALDAELTSMAFHDPLTWLLTAPCSPSRPTPPWHGRHAAARRSRCSSWAWTASSGSTTGSATEPGMRRCESWLPGSVTSSPTPTWRLGGEFVVLLADLADLPRRHGRQAEHRGALRALPPRRPASRQGRGEPRDRDKVRAPSSPGMDSAKEGRCRSRMACSRRRRSLVFRQRRGTGYEMVSGQRRKR